MSKAVTRFFETPDKAIKAARSRAKSSYTSQYVYQTGDTFYIRGGPTDPANRENTPLMKVTYEGEVQQMSHEAPHVSSLGKCDVKGCEREAARASVALLPEGGGVPVVVCQEHYEEGTKRYEELHPPKKQRKGRGNG